MTTCEYLFVYGTLLSGYEPNKVFLLQNQCELIAQATLQANLYLIAHYPGLVLSDNKEEIAYGEVYFMKQPKETLNKLDHYEECSEKNPKPHEYSRHVLEVNLPQQKPIKAWTYLYNYSINHLNKIASGNFRDI